MLLVAVLPALSVNRTVSDLVPSAMAACTAVFAVNEGVSETAVAPLATLAITRGVNAVPSTNNSAVPPAVPTSPVIVADTVATFPLSTDSRRLDATYCISLGTLVTRLFCDAIQDGHLDSRGSGISELAELVADREVSPEQLFTFVHIVMKIGRAHV